MRLPRRHQLDAKQLKQALLRAAIGVLKKGDPNLNVLLRPEDGSSTFKTSTQNDETPRGFDSVDYIAIKTSQTQWLQFSRDKADKYWKGLNNTFTYVAVSTVDNIWDPKFAYVHKFPVRDVKDRLNRAYDAIKAAGKIVKPGVPISISLYDREEEEEAPLYFIGAGIGIRYQWIAKVPLKNYMSLTAKKPKTTHLTKSEARRRLALTYNLPEEAVLITFDRSLISPVSPDSKKSIAGKTFGSTQAKALLRRSQRADKKQKAEIRKQYQAEAEADRHDKMVKPAKKVRTKLDVYQSKKYLHSRIAVRIGAGLPPHVDPAEWILMAPGTSKIIAGVGGDIRARGFCLFEV